MPHFAAKISYDGTEFSGWQRQPHSRTVQQVFQEALEVLSPGGKSQLFAAGRTDAGVHAKAQVVSFDMKRLLSERRLLPALNASLPQSVRVVGTANVWENFNAQYAAKWREYRFFLWNAPFIYPHLSRYVWWIPGKWNFERAEEACSYLKGTHDFKAFCRATDLRKETVRTLFHVGLRHKGPLIELSVRGDGFLTNMVRIMLGSLDQVARGNKNPTWIDWLLNGDVSRKEAGRTAPPQGLFFWGAHYEPSPEWFGEGEATPPDFIF